MYFVFYMCEGQKVGADEGRVVEGEAEQVGRSQII